MNNLQYTEDFTRWALDSQGSAWKNTKVRFCYKTCLNAPDRPRNMWNGQNTTKYYVRKSCRLLLSFELAPVEDGMPDFSGIHFGNPIMVPCRPLGIQWYMVSVIHQNLLPVLVVDFKRTYLRAQKESKNVPQHRIYYFLCVLSISHVSESIEGTQIPVPSQNKKNAH